MATLTKKNEKVVAPFYKNGVTLQMFTITFESDVSAKLDMNGAERSPVTVALEAIAGAASIEVIGTVSTVTLRIAVAAAGGDFGTAMWDGTNSETFATYLTSLVAASGTHDGVDNANTTVVAFTL